MKDLKKVKRKINISFGLLQLVLLITVALGISWLVNSYYMGDTTQITGIVFTIWIGLTSIATYRYIDKGRLECLATWDNLENSDK